MAKKKAIEQTNLEIVLKNTQFSMSTLNAEQLHNLPAAAALEQVRATWAVAEQLAKLEVVLRDILNAMPVQ